LNGKLSSLIPRWWVWPGQMSKIITDGEMQNLWFRIGLAGIFESNEEEDHFVKVSKSLRDQIFPLIQRLNLWSDRSGYEIGRV
jgi:hypothetical protein